jgi:hypothetical protein
MAQSLVVTAALVVLKDPDGRDAYLYQGAPVPDWATKDQLKNVEGMVGKRVDLIAEAEAEAEAPAYDPAAGAPAKSAKKGDWEAYARSKGAGDADLDGKSKDDLIAAYGD